VLLLQLPRGAADIFRPYREAPAAMDRVFLIVITTGLIVLSVGLLVLIWGLAQL